MQPGEEMVHQTSIGSSWFYIICIWASFIPPFIFGFLLAVFTLFLDRSSVFYITNKRVAYRRKRPWHWNPSYTEIELETITKVQKDSTAGFDSTDKFLNGMLSLGEVEVSHQHGGEARTMVFKALRNPVRCIEVLTNLMEK